MLITEFTPEILKEIEDNNIEEIKIDSNYNLEFPKLPPCIQIINFSRVYELKNKDLDVISYENDTSKFNKKLSNLPENLITLFFPLKSDFSQPVDNLPSSLLYLRLGKNFSQPVDNLPPNLLSLELNCKNFSHPIDNLPKNLNLLYLIFDNDFSHTLNNLPTNITKLKIYTPNALDYNYLPSNVKKLDISIQTDKNYDKNLIDNLPNSIEELSIDGNFSLDNLPNSIKSLSLSSKYKQHFNFLPNSIEVLYLGYLCDFNLENLPISIKKICICICNKFSLTGIENLINLKELYISSTHERFITDALEYLELNDFYEKYYKYEENHYEIQLSQELKNLIPKCIIKIDIGEKYRNTVWIRIDNTK